MNTINQLIILKRFLVILILTLGLSSCVDWQKDPNSYYSNEKKYINELDSLKSEFDKNISYYYNKYNFKSVQDTSQFNLLIRKKYEYWKNDWSSKLDYYYLKENAAEKVDEAYIIWYISIGIGLIIFSSLSSLEFIERKWIRAITLFVLLLLIWLGTSCYAYIFMKYESRLFGIENVENSFFTISTQFKFFIFMIFWIFNSIYIWLIWICGRRMITNLVYTCLSEMIELGSFDAGLISKERKQKKDDRFKILLTYSAMTFALLLFYYHENPVMTFFVTIRNRAASTYYGLESYWLSFIILIFIIAYFVFSAINLSDLEAEED